jgi:hypothetical protein
MELSKLKFTACKAGLATDADSTTTLPFYINRRRNHVKFLCRFCGHKQASFAGAANENYLLLCAPLALQAERA